MPITHLPERDTERHLALFSLCGKIRSDFKVNEWIGSEFQGANCEACLRFETVVHKQDEDPTTGDAIGFSICGVPHCCWTPEWHLVTCKDCKERQPDRKGGGSMKIRIKHYGAYICTHKSKFNEPLTVTSVYADRNGCVEVTGRYFCEAPMEGDPALSIGVQFMVTGVEGEWSTIKPVGASQAAMPAASETLITVEHSNAMPDPDLVMDYGKHVEVGARFEIVRANGGYCYMKNDNYVICEQLLVGHEYEIVEIVGNDQWNVKDVTGSPIATHAATDSGHVAPAASATITLNESETVMNGVVYIGFVVRTKTVAAGIGVTTGKEISQVIFNSEPKVYPNAESARANILAQAKIKLDKDLDLEDPTQPVEVKLIIPNV